jgi:hypothetical protein
MNPETPLWRQIHPSFMVGGKPGSQAFRPTPKDQDLLSFDDGTRITAEASWQRHTGPRGLTSIGVMGLTVAECAGECLPVIADGVPDPEHVSVSFDGRTTSQRKTISKRLRDFALTRGWQFGPVELMA